MPPLAIHVRTWQILGPQVEGWKDGWPKTIGLFLTGKYAETELFRRTGEIKNAKVALESTGQANYYAGMLALLDGRQSAAREKFLAGVATRANLCVELALAKAELARLK